MTQIVPIFSGGGTRLPAYIGVIQGLHKLNIEFDQMVGVSGGSIVAALYCCGRSLDDIFNLALTTNFKQFREFSIFRLLRDGGLSSGDKFEKWMDVQLEGKKFSDLTVDLDILATDVNGGGPVVFNKILSPNLKVSAAVRFSMSIPLIFSFKQYNEHLLVDGAILSEDALFHDWSGKGVPIVCFRLKSNAKKQVIKKTFFPLTQYIILLIRTFMTSLSREYVAEGYWHNTIVINTGTTSAVDFAMTDDEKRDLFEKGYNTVVNFLPNKMQMFKKK